MAVAASALALLCAIGAHGIASAGTEKRAKEQLREVERATAKPTQLDPTAELRDLALALPRLSGDAARRARKILARPPQGSGGFGGGWPGNAVERTVETPSFVVHYAEVPDCSSQQPNPDVDCDEPDPTDDDLNGVPDFVDATVDALNQSIAVENAGLGWPYPKGDGDEGEPSGSVQDDRFDVYLSDLCDESDFRPCVFGYAQIDDGSASCISPPFQCSAYLVLDNDYHEFGASGGELGLRVSAAHEYNHALQFNLDTNQDDWMLEASATWIEEHVFPEDDDWLRTYMDEWASEPQVPITKSGFRMYGSAVWNHWLENGGAYGPHIVLDAWEVSRDTEPPDFGVGAYDQAIRDAGGSGFGPEFAEFTAATAEWNTGEANLPDAAELPAVRRTGKLTPGGKAAKLTLDNTSYALFRVDPEGLDQIRLKGRSPGSVRWSIALVGRVGGRFNGSVDRLVKYADANDRRGVTLPNAQSYRRITAVVTNADGSVSGTKPTFGNFSYTRNNQEFRLKLR